MITVARVAAEAAILCPCLLLGILGASALRDQPLAERWAGAIARTLLTLGFVAAVVCTVAIEATAGHRVWLNYGTWIEVPGHQFKMILFCVIFLRKFF